MGLSMHIFRCGDKALVVEELSHWQIVRGGNRAELLVWMQSGASISFSSDDLPGTSENAFTIEKGLLDFLAECGRR